MEFHFGGAEIAAGFALLKDGFTVGKDLEDAIAFAVGFSVETDFGFHIIKLERGLETKDENGKPSETYDVRHILISTGYKDPENPTGREMPVKDFVRNKLETDKEKALVDSLVAKNNIHVPDDFTVPEVTEEQMQQMKQKQPGMPGGMGQGGMPPPSVSDKEPKPGDKKPPAAPKKK